MFIPYSLHQVREEWLKEIRSESFFTRWRRYAMLTPCFVSTFFMLPRYFKYAAWDEEINADKLEKCIKEAVARGVKVKVYTDSFLDMRGKELKTWAEKGREALEEWGVELVIVQGIHNKTLWVDDVYFVEGSFNWLSAQRKPSSLYFLHNTSMGYTGGSVAEFIRDAASQMEEITKKVARNYYLQK